MTATGPDEAVANGRAVTRYEQGMCQKYVRGPCWEVPSLYGSAIEAWNGAKHKHPGDRNPPKGAPTYYRGGSYGHAVISVGGGRIRSTDCTSSTYVNDAALSWPETAWGYTYLGWTEDINGVMCPGLSGDPEPEPEGEDMPEYVRATMDGRNLSGEWVPVVWDAVPGDSRGNTANEGEASLRIGGRRYVATLSAQVTLGEGSDGPRTRTTEGDVSSGGWQTVETNRACEHARTTGDTYIVDTRAGTVSGEGGADNRRLRWEITAPAGSRLVSAEVQLVYW